MSRARTAEQIAADWLHYGKRRAKHKSLWDDSNVFSSGPLVPNEQTTNNVPGLRDYSYQTAGAAWTVGAGDRPKYVQGSVRGQTFWAGQYDGSNDYAAALNNPAFDVTPTKSVSYVAWVACTGGSNYPGVVYRRDPGSFPGGGLLVDTTGGLFKAAFSFSDGLDDLAVSSTMVVNDGVFRAWAGVLNRADNTMKLWVSGLLQNSIDASAIGDCSNSFNLVLGKRGEASTNIFAGSISGVAIYSRAITPSEIATLARHPLAAYETIRPRYWMFPTTAATTHLWPWQIRRMRRTAGAR